MADNPAPIARPLMGVVTFEDNFRDTWVKQTFLCYEVEVREGDAWTPMQELRGFLHNQGADTCSEPRRHAELCFLDLFRSWTLDPGKQYRLTWYISWSPCPDCALELVLFLLENTHVSLRIFAARIYTKYEGFKHGLCLLLKAGAQLAIMTHNEHQHCWDTFVDNRGQPFQPWPNMEGHIGAQSQQLEDILGNPEN